MNLEKASKIYAHETLKHLPSDEEIRKMHRFSDRFRKNMAKLMRGLNEKDARGRRKRRIISFGNNMQRFAAVILLFIVFFFTVGMSVDAVREPMFEMTEVVFKDHVDLIPKEYLEQYQQEHLVGEALLQHYVSGLEALGYQQGETTETCNGTLIQFKKEVELLLYRVGYDTDAHSTIDYELGKYKSLTYSGKKFRYSMEKCVIYWEDEDAVYMIRCDASEAELLNIIRNII